MAQQTKQIVKVPQQYEIAKHLGKLILKFYTGHCFRRTCATLLAEACLSSHIIKNAGNWKSTTVAEGYIDNSDRMKEKIANFTTKLFESASIKSENLDPNNRNSTMVYYYYFYT